MSRVCNACPGFETPVQDLFHLSKVCKICAGFVVCNEYPEREEYCVDLLANEADMSTINIISWKTITSWAGPGLLSCIVLGKYFYSYSCNALHVEQFFH